MATLDLTRTIYYLLVLLCFMAMSGCAPAKWAPVTVGEADLTWPPPPALPRVRYLYEIKGFRQTGQTLSSFIFGKSESGNILKPVAVAVGPDGRMAVADQQRKGIHLYIPALEKYHFLFQAGDDMLVTPVGVTFSSDNMLFIADSGLRKVVKFDAELKFQGTIEKADGEPLLRPSGIVCNCALRRLHVTDTLKHQILVFNRHGELLARIGLRGEKKGQFNFPTHLALDRDGDVYVTDAMNFRAQIYSPTTGKWRMFGSHGNGTGDFASPKGIAVDGKKVIYIAETLFDTIQLFDQSGRYLLAVGSKGSGPGQFWMPSGIFIDRRDRLYVCDTYNQRVQVFQLILDE